MVYNLKKKKEGVVVAWRLEKQASGWKSASSNAHGSWENQCEDNEGVEYSLFSKSAATSATEENVLLYLKINYLKV